MILYINVLILKKVHIYLNNGIKLSVYSVSSHQCSAYKLTL